MAVTASGHRRVGGRFSVLAADDEDEDDDRYQPDAPSPSPSDLVCESILAGYTEEQVANSIDGFVPPSDSAWDGLGHNDDERIEVLRQVVHRRTSSSAIRPWKGPIPKVRLPALTLADFIDTWKKVLFRRKNNRSPVSTRPPATILAKTDLRIREAREKRLNLMLGRDGPETASLGPVTTGYMAQLNTLQNPKENRVDSYTSTISTSEHGTVSIVDKDRSARVPDESYIGFPSRAGRARRVPALGLPTMAARAAGNAPSGTQPEHTAALTPVGGTRVTTHRPGDGAHAGARGQPRGGGSGVGTGRGGYGSGPSRGGGGYQGDRNFGQNWNENYGGLGGGRGKWNAGGGPGGGANQWHRPFSLRKETLSKVPWVQTTVRGAVAEVVPLGGIILCPSGRKLVSETYQWAPERLDDHSFQVEFPRREDLQRLLTFGVSRVSGRKFLLEFEECKKPEPQGSRLQKVWIRFSGIPETLLNDFLIVWSLGSLIGKTEKVDMSFTRKRGIARLLVMVLDVEYIPDFAPWSYDGVHYDLDVEVEVDIPPKSNDGDVDMTDRDERDKDQGDTKKDKSSDRSKDSINPSSSSAKENPLFNVVAPSSSATPMATLRLGSFEVTHEIGHLEGAVHLNLGAQQKINKALTNDATVTSAHACMMARQEAMPHNMHDTVVKNDIVDSQHVTSTSQDRYSASTPEDSSSKVRHACMSQDLLGSSALVSSQQTDDDHNTGESNSDRKEHYAAEMQYFPCTPVGSDTLVSLQRTGQDHSSDNPVHETIVCSERNFQAHPQSQVSGEIARAASPGAKRHTTAVGFCDPVRGLCGDRAPHRSVAQLVLFQAAIHRHGEVRGGEAQGTAPDDAVRSRAGASPLEVGLPQMPLQESIKQWQKGFFYVKNADPAQDALNMPLFNIDPPTRLNWAAKTPKPIPEVALICAHLETLEKSGLLDRDLLTTMVTRRILLLQRRPHLVCQMSGRHDPCRLSTKRFTPGAVARRVNLISTTRMDDGGEWSWGMTPFNRFRPPPILFESLQGSLRSPAPDVDMYDASEIEDEGMIESRSDSSAGSENPLESEGTEPSGEYPRPSIVDWTDDDETPSFFSSAAFEEDSDGVEEVSSPPLTRGQRQRAGATAVDEAAGRKGKGATASRPAPKRPALGPPAGTRAGGAKKRRGAGRRQVPMVAGEAEDVEEDTASATERAGWAAANAAQSELETQSKRRWDVDAGKTAVGQSRPSRVKKPVKKREKARHDPFAYARAEEPASEAASKHAPRAEGALPSEPDALAPVDLETIPDSPRAEAAPNALELILDASDAAPDAPGAAHLPPIEEAAPAGMMTEPAAEPAHGAGAIVVPHNGQVAPGAGGRVGSRPMKTSRAANLARARLPAGTALIGVPELVSLFSSGQSKVAQSARMVCGDMERLEARTKELYDAQAQAYNELRTQHLAADGQIAELEVRLGEVATERDALRGVGNQLQEQLALLQTEKRSSRRPAGSSWSRSATCCRRRRPPTLSTWTALRRFISSR
ncbi:hypothetical protein D1007_35790 [Hordeum vulgare]|nr:hypothetical protein D1007_35790 [Hordeum vulgare]